MVVQRKDVEHGSRDRLQIDPTAGQFKAAIDQAIFLVEILQPLLRRLAGMVLLFVTLWKLELTAKNASMQLKKLRNRARVAA